MEVWVATITGVFSLGSIALASLLQIRRLRIENTSQHGESRTLLSRLDERSAITLDRVENVSGRLDEHLNQHQADSRPASQFDTDRTGDEH